jgi:hypothetical protein
MMYYIFIINMCFHLPTHDSVCLRVDGASDICPSRLCSAMPRRGEGLAMVASLIMLALVLMWLFLVWMPSFQMSLG